MGRNDSETFLIYWGKTVFQWVDIFNACHNIGGMGVLQWTTPDGKAISEQPQYQSELFSLINVEISKKIKRETPK